MERILKVKKSNNQIVKFMMIIGLFVFSMSGCQQVNDAVNGKTATNTNTATNSNATANANVYSNTNSNANTSVSQSNSATNTNDQASNSAANTVTAPKAEVPLTEEAKAFAFSLNGKWKKRNDNIDVTFAEGKYDVKSGDRVIDNGSYRVLDEETVEINSLKQTRSGKATWNATMKILDDGNTLDWQEAGGANFMLERVKL